MPTIRKPEVAPSPPGVLHHRLVEQYAPPSVLVDAGLDVLHLSERAGRYLAIGGGEPTRSLPVLVHHGLRDALVAAVAEARQGGAGAASRRARIRLDGSDRQVEVGVRVGPERDGAPLLVTFDEREPARGSIDAAPRLRLAERAAALGAWELDVATGELAMSDDAARLHGFAPRDELDVAQLLERIHALDRGRVASGLARAFAGEVLDVEARLHDPRSGLRWLRFTGEVVAGAPAGTIIGVTVDVTHLRRTEEALRASQERFRLAVRTSPVVITTQDADLRYTWGHVLGGPVDFIGKTDEDLFPPEEAAALGAIKREVRDSRTGRRAEIALTVGGRVHYYDFKVEPILHDDTAAGVSCAAVDVTASKLAELELCELDRRKDEFLATLAHELRNPLAPLQAALDIQQLADGDLERIARARAIMERQVAQIVRLVDDLLDASRITSGTIRLQIGRVALGDMVDGALEAVRPLFESRRHRVEVLLPTEPVELEVDRVRFVQVVTNLLSNAAAYTPPGGAVTLSAGLDLARTHLVVRVKDDGAGIAPERLPHVFDMFSRDEGVLERAQGGLGIGLNLVRQLVELHGGTIDAHSAGPGQGSEFVMRLPVSRGKEHGTMQVADRRPKVRSGTPRRVLVVDDNPDVTDSMCELLRMLGHEVVPAADGPSALAAFGEHAPDLVLLDLGLPGMSGLEVARQLRASPRGAEITLVAVTGWGQPEDLARSHEAGFDHHLVKPAGLVALREIVGDATRHGKT